MQKIDVPMLIIYGSSGLKVPFEAADGLAAEIIEGARLKITARFHG